MSDSPLWRMIERIVASVVRGVIVGLRQISRIEPRVSAHKKTAKNVDAARAVVVGCFLWIR
jgi:hypothetical protein